MAVTLKGHLLKELSKLAQISPDELVEGRYEKFRRMGVFEEG